MKKIFAGVLAGLLLFFVGVNFFRNMFGEDDMLSNVVFGEVVDFSDMSLYYTKIALSQTFVMIEEADVLFEGVDDTIDAQKAGRGEDWGVFRPLFAVYEVLLLLVEVIFNVVELVYDAFMYFPVIFYVLVDAIEILKDIFNLIFGLLY